MTFRLLEALEKLHQLKWLHCDIKSDNIMFRRHFNQAELTLCLIDFGLSLISRGEANRTNQGKPPNCKCIDDITMAAYVALKMAETISRDRRFSS
uniref:Protein kinase domain-containing protein n=1 Tax=Caenorhabditis tropicalis TaxID=1561998 RepID=A0A1I7TPH4_9PELO